MQNQVFRFKKFSIAQQNCAMKVGTDAVLLGAWTIVPNQGRILDIGSGTGILAIMLAQRSNLHIDAIEIDTNAYLQSIENVSNCPWPDKINIMNGAVQDFADVTTNTYDLIVSNPPYFIDSLKGAQIHRNLARHNDSLPFSDLIRCSSRMLNPNGRLAIILPYAEACIFIAEAAKSGLFCIRKTNVKSKPKTPVIRLLLEFSFTAEPVSEDFLVLESENPNVRSEKYKLLTSEFYL